MQGSRTSGLGPLLPQDQACSRTLTWDRAIQRQTAVIRTDTVVIQPSVLSCSCFVRKRTSRTLGSYSWSCPRIDCKAWWRRVNWASVSVSGSPRSRPNSHAAGPILATRLLRSLRRSRSSPDSDSDGKMLTASRTPLTTMAASTTVCNFSRASSMFGANLSWINRASAFRTALPGCGWSLSFFCSWRCFPVAPPPGRVPSRLP